MQIKLGRQILTVEENDNTLMEPQFMEVICIWAGLTGLAQGERGLASYIGELMLKIARFHT